MYTLHKNRIDFYTYLSQTTFFQFFEIFSKKVLTNLRDSAIIHFVDAVREHAGIGRQARLRGVCFVRVGSSPTARTNNKPHTERYAVVFFSPKKIERLMRIWRNLSDTPRAPLCAIGLVELMSKLP